MGGGDRQIDQQTDRKRQRELPFKVQSTMTVISGGGEREREREMGQKMTETNTNRETVKNKGRENGKLNRNGKIEHMAETVTLGHVYNRLTSLTI